MRLLMVGPPGSGKGTHGTRLANDFGIEHVSSGDVLRAEIASGSPLGQELGGYVTRGDLVPDDVLFALMVPLAVRAEDFVSDGFPRTLAQAERAYREIGIDRDRKLDAVISLDAPEEVLTRRMLDRAEAQGRADDTPVVISHRLAVYRTQTYPLLDYYRDRGILLTINGNQTPEHVYADIRQALAALTA